MCSSTGREYLGVNHQPYSLYSVREPLADLANRRAGPRAASCWRHIPFDTSSRWFTLGQGVLNEVYYPRVD